MTQLGLTDDLLAAQALRALGAAPAGGADAGEVLAALAACRGDDLGAWYDAWAAMAAQVRVLAESERAAGRTESARRAFLRAMTYDRTAGVMLMGTPTDPRLVDAYRRQRSAFREAAALMPHPVAPVEVPYEGTSLPGYHLRVADDGRSRPTVVLVNGYDGTAEELYVATGAGALARGYDVLMVDGPGQGAALLEQGLLMRHDWEAVVTPTVDWLLEQPGVDADRLVLMGWSLGGHLAPRAAAYEHRIAALVADCGSYDMYAAALARIPGPLRPGLDGSGVRRRALESVLERVAGRPTGGWGLRRGLQVHGVPTPLEYLRALRDYRLVGHAEKITCPTLVCQAERDDISASAPDLVAALTCPKEHLLFRAAEGAGDHCESGARELFLARAFGWLATVLPTAAR